MAGETVMDGFVDFKIPINLRRIITMLPGAIVILAGVNPMKALVISQASLSFALPAAIIPMIIITSNKKLMGEFVNKSWAKIVGWAIASIIIALNVVLLYLTFTGNV
ncbi:Divalent metal cation transporter MntH [bioreactor metagenome]|uniref:Divalent metal cation transporter MntH n=2 Tax=root TaxID=1 RepID=A0A645IBY4_9ZZZZ